MDVAALQRWRRFIGIEHALAQGQLF